MEQAFHPDDVLTRVRAIGLCGETREAEIFGRLLSDLEQNRARSIVATAVLTYMQRHRVPDWCAEMRVSAEEDLFWASVRRRMTRRDGTGSPNP